MNARPYIFGCLCLVGAAGTAAASDIDPSGLLTSSGSSASSSFEGAGRGPQSSRDGGGGDVAPARPAASSHRDASGGTVSPPVDTTDMSRDDVSPLRSAAPSWQSLLPGSML